MQVKKYPFAKLENYSKILFLLGFVLSLFIVYEFVKLKSYPSEYKELKTNLISVKTDDKIAVDIQVVEPEAKPEVKASIPDKIIKVDNKIEVPETIIESTEIDENTAVVREEVVKQLIPIPKEEEEIVEDVPFVIIENVPVFPGCVGNNSVLRACFSDQISNFVSKNFRAELATDLGLEPGSVQKIFVLFKIDKNGNITDIQARAPHKSLQEEAIRVIKLLPKMTPGMQRGKPVGVKYSLPIAFKVE